MRRDRFFFWIALLLGFGSYAVWAQVEGTESARFVGRYFTSVNGYAVGSTEVISSTGFYTGTVGSNKVAVTPGFYRAPLQASGGATALGVTVDTQQYIPVGGVQAPNATENLASPPAAAAYTAKNLRCFLTGGPGTGSTETVMFRKAPAAAPTPADTTLTCTITGSGTTCSDTTHTVSVAAGDLLDIGVTPSGTPTPVAQKIHCGIEADM